MDSGDGLHLWVEKLFLCEIVTEVKIKIVQLEILQGKLARWKDIDPLD